MVIKNDFFIGRLLLLMLLISPLVTTQALAQSTFPTKIPTKAKALEAVVKLIPGLDKAGISNFKASGNTASGDIKLKGKTVTVVAFKRTGIPKVLIAIAPGNFKLTDFLPIPRGTPIDGISFKDMVFIYVPKGAAKKGVSTSGLPTKVASALNKSGSKVDLNEGLNLFGEADFASSGGVKKVLKAIGLNNFTLPLNGTLSKDLFKHNPKIVSGKLKDKLLDTLRLELKLKKLHIPGIPSTVSIKNAGFTILSKKLKNKREFIAGVNGKLQAKIGSKNIDFAFYVLADKAGANSKVTLKGDTQTKTTLPFFHPLALTAMNLEATKSGGKWDVVVNAKAKLNGKEVDVALTHDPKDGASAEITGKIKLSDLLPGLVAIPGITDVEFDDLQINKDFLQVTGKIKKLDTVIAVFKRNGKTYVAINNPRPIRISSLITAAKGTPLDDASFQHMSYIWAPKGGAEKGMELSTLPPDIAYNVKQVVKKVDLKEGLNVIGRMAVEENSKVGKMLTTLGAYKDHLPLLGKLSPKLFHPGSGAAIKNEILDNLDLNIPLPKLALPGISKVANIHRSALSIKGINKGGKRSIDVKVVGELDVKVSNEKVAFDFYVEVKPRPGKKPEIVIAATETPGKTIKIKIMEEFTLKNLSFNMNNAQDRWVWELSGDTEFRSKTVNVGYIHDPKAGNFMAINTKMTLADIAGGSLGLPGLDDVMLENIQLWKNKFVLESEVKGKKIWLVSFKRPGISKPYISVQIGNAAATDFIPGSENTPLKDVKFENLSFLYSPAKQVGKASDRGIIPNVRGWLNHAGKDAVIKPGLNIYGKLVAHPTGEMAKLLKNVGVTDLSLPLNGKFSPKAFSKGNVKNAILDGLDMDIKLPKLKIPEIDKFLAFKNGRLKIKGKTPDGKRGIDVAVSGDADLRIKGDRVAFKINIEYDKSELSFKGSTEEKWIHPLGVKFLDLDSLTIDIDKKKGTYDIKMAAKTDIGSHSRLDVKVDIHEKNGHITDAFFELDGPLKLSEIPGVKDIPSAAKFEINALKISEHGIEAKTDFGGKKDLDIFLFPGAGWNLIIRQDNFTLTKFVPPLKNTPLKHIVLSEAAIVLSKDGLQGPLSGFSIIAQDALKEIYGANASNIDVDSGLSLIAAFEHKKSKGGMSDAFSRLGLSEERVILTGRIGGLFGGPMVLNVDVDLSTHTGAKNQPKWMKKKPGVKAVLSLIATETAGQFDIEIGIGADITADVHGTELDFTAKTALEFQDKKIDVKIVADLKDKRGWHKPFGIPGFTLKEVGMDLGIAEDGAIHLGFDGSIIVSGDKYAIAADADLLPEALGAPQDIAFVGSASKVDMFFMEAIAIDMLGGDFNIDIPGGILPTFTDVKFAFVTPGAQDPDLNITSEGFALKGAMNWLDHELGSMDVAVSPKSGIVASGKIDNFDLGPLHLKNNDFKMDISPRSVQSITVDADVEILGIVDKFHFDFNKNGIDFAATSDFGDLFKFNINADIAGKNLTSASGIRTADIFLDASLKSDPGAWLRNFGSVTVKKKFATFDSFAVKAQNDVNKAKAKVDSLQAQITAMQAKVKAEKRAAVTKLNAQQVKVNSLQNQINGLNGRINGYQSRKGSCNQEESICDGWSFNRGSCAHRIWGHCIWYHYNVSCSRRINVPNIPARLVCEAENLVLDVEIAATEVEKGGVIAAKATADEILKGIAAGIEIVPTDLDPRVAGLILLKKGADLALDATKEAMKGVLAFAKVLEKGTNVFKNTPSLFVLVNSSIQGDLKKALKGDPVVLDMNARIMGKTLEHRLAFSLTKPEFDADQFSFIALGIAMDTVVKAAEDIKIIPAFLINDLERVYTDEKKRIDRIINAAVAANGVTGKPGVNQTTQAIAAMKAKRAAKAQAAGKANQAALAKAEAAHQADYDKFCSVPGNDPRTMRPVFDPCFYLNHNPDLAKAFGADFNKAAQHWLSNGISEGRMSSPEFSTLAYVVRYEDLTNVFTGTGGNIDFMAAVNHWVSSGSKEGRNPKPLECSNTGGAKGAGKIIFDPCFYVNKYPDLKAAMGNSFLQAYTHWINHGIEEGRQSSSVFAIADYVIRYPGPMSGYTASTGTNYPGAVDHWRVNGRKEGRNSTPFQACGSSGGIRELADRIFDPCFYVNKYPDLKKSFGYNNARALSHWLGAGLKNGRQSSGSFDINAYVVRYPDLENIFIDTTTGAIGYASAMEHWKVSGKKEGRNPKPFPVCSGAGGIAELERAEFDPCYYLNYYPDLKTKLAGRLELATQHYYQLGRKEGNRSSAGFDISSYILRYPDLTKVFISPASVNFTAAWDHWKTGGKKDGLNPAPLGACGKTGGIVSLAKAKFDPCFYLNAYPDLKQAFGKNWGKAAQHWMFSGFKEGRRSSKGFSIRAYLMRYDDLRKTFIDVKTGTADYGSVMDHWKKSGKKEGRNPGPLNCTASGGAPGLQKSVFDPCFYLNKYTDLKKAFDGDWVKAAQHWIQFGIKEGRQSSAGFSIKAYLNRYPDLKKVFTVTIPGGIKAEGFKREPSKTKINYAAALNHWYTSGKKEGRNPRP